MKLTSISAVLAVAAGGAVGSVMRYLISLMPCRGSFPLPTLIANLLGALIIGFIAGYAPLKGAGKNTVLFFKTGMCGGFTTFSTFSLEAFGLFEKGRNALGAAYIIMSVAGCLLGVWAGMTAGKYFGRG
jgi:CrcB protein